MSISKELIAGVAAGTLVGGLFSYLFFSPKKDKKTEPGHVNLKAYADVPSALDAYLLKNSLREIEVLTKLKKHTFANVSKAFMLSDSLQAQFFRMLLKMLNAKKCIEVGVYTGLGSLNMALALPEDGVVYALDINEKYVSHGKPFFEEAKVADKINIRLGNAVESLETLINEGHTGTFDFIFIDADKVSYDAYYEKALILLRPGGMIALDNTFFGGTVLNLGQGNEKAEAIHKLNLKVRNDNRVMMSQLKLADGVTLCLKL